MKPIVCLLALLWTGNLCGADPLLIDSGTARAEIIIAEDPPRTTHLAARDLQHYLKKISGAELDIRTTPTQQPIKIYVGESRHTKQLGLRTDDLKYGAYRIISGDRWLALLGQDSDFTPIEPWPRGHQDIRSGKMQTAWNKITGENWGYMHSQLHKHYSGPRSLFGTPDERRDDDDGNIHVWTYDERGSFNAVCSFLRGLGVRWYMPGELGEVVPKKASIALPAIDETTHPDFPMRILNFRPAVYGHDVMMWGFRLGLRQPYGRQAAHGLRGMTDNEPTLREHPEWFALYGGRRHNDPNVKNNQLCYSNEELLQQTVRFARAQLDHFDMDVVSIMPPDGYTAICQCELCEGKESPELGPRGRLSNYVWDFVNRVAVEVDKTHPDKRVSCCAYGVYTEAPSNLEKLSPNLQVIIVGGRRPLQEDREDLRRLRSAWQKKTDLPLEIFENYPFTARGFYLPAYIPRVLGESINETKGQSRGEDIWISMDFSEKAVGLNHFLAYFTSRMYWGGKHQDPVALFDEYVNKFYGPAKQEMRAFFAYCEENWRAMETDRDTADRALELFTAAKLKVSADSIYRQRIALIDRYLDGLRNKATQLAQQRGPVPVLRLVSGADRRGTIKIDGILDDGPWKKIPTASTGRLRELQTGTLPTFATTFQAEWIGNDLYFAVRCEEPPNATLNVTTSKDGDPAIWYGDLIEVEIATDAHNYYQIAVNPAGALVDFDRGAPRNQWAGWSSQAEVATKIEEDHWTVELRLPITQDKNDPLHQIIGNKPTRSLPWFVNVCRQRIRDDGSEFSAFSPTGKKGFHEPLKFAHFFAGNSHRFHADSTVRDFAIDFQAADQHARSRKWSEAQTAFQKLADADQATDFQRAKALQHAVRCALAQNNFEQATGIAKQISIDAARQTADMQILSAQRRWQEIVDRFKDEDFSKWPFWQIGDGALERGRAFFQTKAGEESETDLELALTHQADKRTQVSIRAMLGYNREQNLNDTAGALRFYRENIERKQRIGAAEEFRSVQRAAAILSGQGEHEQALTLLERVDFEKQRGFWLHEMLLVRGMVLQATGRKSEARQHFQQVAEDNSASQSQRNRASALIQ